MKAAKKVIDSKFQISKELSGPENQAYWDRRATVLERAKELENLANHVARNEHASLADLKEVTKYPEEAARLRQRANDSTDDLKDFAAVSASGSDFDTSTCTPKQHQKIDREPSNMPKRVSSPNRRDLLWSVIEKAQKNAIDPFDANEVFLILRDWAQVNPPKKPFIGITSTGLQWMNASDEAKELSLEALKKRIGRAANKYQ